MISVQLYSKLLGHENIISFGYCFIQFMAARLVLAKLLWQNKTLPMEIFVMLNIHVYLYITVSDHMNTFRITVNVLSVFFRICRLDQLYLRTNNKWHRIKFRPHEAKLIFQYHISNEVFYGWGNNICANSF